MKWLLLVRSSIEERLPLVRFYLAIELIGLVLILFRQLLPVDKTFIFLLWNFFLALVPLVLSTVILQMQKRDFNLFSQLFIGLIWLLFYPNAPYMLTDHIHLSYGDRSHYWLDAITVGYFMLAAFVTSVISLKDIAKALSKHLSEHWVNLVVYVLCGLVGLGIILGRDLRYNSWDAVMQPKSLIRDGMTSLSNPMENIYAWSGAVMISFVLFGAFVLWPKKWERF